MRERAEMQCQECEAELEALQQKRQMRQSTSSLNVDASQELARSVDVNHMHIMLAAEVFTLKRNLMRE